jgi:hypothetical protein
MDKAFSLTLQSLQYIYVNIIQLPIYSIDDK